MYAILRTEKLKTAGNLGGLNSHLTRSINVPNADPDLTKYNSVLVGTKDLNADVNNRIAQEGITPRKNAVLAVEHLITTSPEFFEGLQKVKNDKGQTVLRADEKTKDNLQEFENRAIEWLNNRYETVNVVNVTLHMDEKTPHIHAVIVPIDGKGKLNARAYFGGREKMKAMQDSFAKEMAPLGLERGVKGSKARHVAVKEFYSRLNNQLEEPSAGYVLSEPPVFGKDKWVQQENEKINQTIQQIAIRSNLQDLDQLYQKRKKEYLLKEDQEKKELKKEVSEMKDKVKNSHSWVMRIRDEAMNHGLKFDMDRGKLVKMTDQEIELHQKEQAQKKADLMAEQQRKQEQGKNRGRGLRM